MRKPLIGLTSDYIDDKPRYMLPFAYTAAVEAAGGIPFILPFDADHANIPAVLDVLDGIIFTGGNDLSPTLWGEQMYHPKAVPIHPQRQKYELALLAQVEARRLPTLGICLGSQLMNVYRGGSLHSFIPDLSLPNALEHRRLETEENRHPVNIQPDTLLHDVIGKSATLANSSHKQCVNKLGKGLRVNSLSPDGVIEGIEDPTFPLFLAVQWHPERIANETDHLRLFEKLVHVAKSGK